MASIQRRKTVAALIGGVRVGSDAPVVVQSMTNTDTADVVSTVQQVAALARAGSELVRVTVNNEEAAAAVAPIVDELEQQDAREVTMEAMVVSALNSAASAEKYGLRPDQIILSAKVSGVQDLIDVYRSLAARCSYPLHLGLTEAGMGAKGIVASSAALGVLLQEGIADTIRVSLTPAPGGDRTEEVRVAQQDLPSLGIRSFSPQVTACPGCGRTTSTFFHEMAEQIQSYLREQMPVWKGRYSGVEEMKVAVMGCVVNGPGESKHANLGISLPGTFEEPKAPVYVDGRLFTTLRGDRIVAEFIKILDRYVESHYADVGAGVPARAV